MALAAIQEEFDVCLFLGDLVDYGLDPLPCIEWVRATCKYAVRGNHDHGAAQRIYLQGNGGFRYLTASRDRSRSDSSRNPTAATWPICRLPFG